MDGAHPHYYEGYRHPPYQPHPYAPPTHHHPYIGGQHPSALSSPQLPYPSPPSRSTESVVEITPQEAGQQERKKRKQEGEVGGEETEDLSGTYIDDPLYLRQQILDNAQALTQALCPTAYGPHNAGRYSVILLQITPRKHKSAATPTLTSTSSASGLTETERWRAGVACDGMLVVEGPKTSCKSQAMNLLLDSMSAKLARRIPRAWDEGSEDSDGEAQEGETGMEEDTAGCRFASERRKR